MRSWQNFQLPLNKCNSGFSKQSEKEIVILKKKLFFENEYHLFLKCLQERMKHTGDS